MASLFTTEGEATVDIDAPDKARRVAEGVVTWLSKLQVPDLRWEQNCLHFRGTSIPSIWAWLLSRAWYLSSHSLVWIKRGTIEFQNDANKVTMKFTLSTHLPSLAGRHVFRSNLQLAGIRGLADGAAAELTALQSKSEHAPVSK